jgi:hypothetical protein
MSHRIVISLLAIFLLEPSSSAQEAGKPLPDRVALLKANYEATLERAAAPIRQKYLEELFKLKTEFTKAGNLEAALATDALLKQLTPQSQFATSAGPEAGKLSDMTLNQFRRWLRNAQIIELEGNKTVFEFDDPDATSVRAAAPTPRVHKNVTVELGILRVPFSTDLCVIRFSDDLKTAEIRYDDEAPLKAEIQVRPK